MSITALKKRHLDSENPLFNKYKQLAEYLTELNKNRISNDIIYQINKEVDELNTIDDQNQLLKSIKQKQSTIVNLVEKQLKIVPKNYYRNLWIVLGMTAFGIPIGVLLGIYVNFALFALGLPAGLAIGAIVGNKLDKKALKEGRQLNVEMKY
jgi:hypothetical protein